MEMFGNVEALKKAIEKKYSSKIKEVEKDRDRQIEGINKELKKEFDLIGLRMKTVTDAAIKKTHSMILSSEKLKAKKEFEEKREALIYEIFRKAEKKTGKIAHSKEYVDYVKKNMPKAKGLVVKGDSTYYKKEFPKLKTDKNIVGVKFESEDVIYDFTLDNMINSKKDVLRQEVSKILFS